MGWWNYSWCRWPGKWEPAVWDCLWAGGRCKSPWSTWTWGRRRRIDCTCTCDWERPNSSSCRHHSTDSTWRWGCPDCRPSSSDWRSPTPFPDGCDPQCPKSPGCPHRSCRMLSSANNQSKFFKKIKQCLSYYRSLVAYLFKKRKKFHCFV